MMHSKKICPYPGLRPFTEAESLYFKGRDLHIKQIISQLEKKKFIMVTGASGDGKSSIIYAGVVPNARGGFFKARFNNWVIVDFRPERSPLKNLAASVIRNLAPGNSLAGIEKELSYGFSALLNIYKSAPCFIDYNRVAWTDSSDEERKRLKRKGSNLLILADQFEEFFTNPENYNRGVTSDEAQTTVNLLVETAKLAFEQDLPVYVVCTMRSDYIGNCAAFRGLPEMIGYSQFFVPRLKRNEIRQVIEEPAALSGNKISNRLIETLINELSEGYDQLPVLQHALNRLWNIADKGKEEMDLLHLAKLSGISPMVLDLEIREKYEAWILTQPKAVKKEFTFYSLEQVLSIHADSLFETADEHYFTKYQLGNEKTKNTISKEEAQSIVKTAFQCLTKIDEGRAVRNRMTLSEITEVINNPDVSAKVVGGVLNIFREQGNTFLSPFITDKPETVACKPETVLDITHESLIRNWNRLGDWAKEENEDWQTFQDFDKQLQRWIVSGKKQGYLLPIGPLTYFESWFNRKKPNEFWLARYDKSELPVEQKIREAKETLNSTGEFIKKSARNLLLTRTVMRYGVTMIAAVFAAIALIFASSFYGYDYYKKQNTVVLREIIFKGKEMLKSPYVKDKTKAHFIINCERLTPGVFKNYLDEEIKEDTARFDVAFEMFLRVQNLTDDESETHNTLMLPLMRYMDKKLGDLINIDFYNRKIIAEDNLRRLNYLLLASLFYLEHDTAADIKIILERQLWNCYKNISANLNKPVDSLSASTVEMNEAFLLLGALKNKNALIDMDRIIKTISPVEGDDSKKRFERLFPEKMKWKVGWDNFLSHNGGYQIMSCLFGAMGKTDKALQCLDSLTKYNKEYKNNDFNGFTSLFGYFAIGSSSPDSLNLVLRKYAKNVNSELNIAWRKIIRNSLIEFVSKVKIWYDFNGNKKFYLDFIPACFDADCRNQIWDAYLFSLQNIEPEYAHLPGWLTTVFSDEEYFNLALYYKKRGAFTASLPNGKEDAGTYFYKAFDYFSKIGDNYLSKDFAIGDDGTKSIKNSTLFLYPGIINEGNDGNPFSITAFPFLEYLIDNSKLWRHYKTKEDIEALKTFLYKYYLTYRYNGYDMLTTKRKKFQYHYYQSILKIIISHPEFKEINMDIFNLLMAEKFFYDKEDTNGIAYLKQLDLSKIFDKSSFSGESTISEVNVNLLTDFAVNFARNNYFDETRKSVSLLPESWQRINALLDITGALVAEGKKDFLFQYLNLLFAETKAKKQITVKLFRILGKTGGNDFFTLAQTQMKNIDDKAKPRALSNFVSGIAESGSYFKAISVVPDYVSSNKELELFTRILNVEIQKEQLNKPEWNLYDNENFKYRWDDYLQEADVIFFLDD